VANSADVVSGASLISLQQVATNWKWIIKRISVNYRIRLPVYAFLSTVAEFCNSFWGSIWIISIGMLLRWWYSTHNCTKNAILDIFVDYIGYTGRDARKFKQAINWTIKKSTKTTLAEQCILWALKQFNSTFQ
jgi:hypothetical protein